MKMVGFTRNGQEVRMSELALKCEVYDLVKMCVEKMMELRLEKHNILYSDNDLNNLTEAAQERVDEIQFLEDGVVDYFMECVREYLGVINLGKLKTVANWISSTSECYPLIYNEIENCWYEDPMMAKRLINKFCDFIFPNG